MMGAGIVSKDSTVVNMGSDGQRGLYCVYFLSGKLDRFVSIAVIPQGKQLEYLMGEIPTGQ